MEKMKLIRWNASESFHICSNRSLQFLLFSTRTGVSSSSSNLLYRRILPVGDPNVSVVPILEQWIEEGRSVTYTNLMLMMKQLRKSRRYTHALEVSNWITDRRMHRFTHGHAAIRLDLISKVRGLEEAEKYLDNVHQSLKGSSVSAALLNCYAKNRCVEKAEFLMQKLREEKCLCNSLSYNVMLDMYFQMGEHDKLQNLVQEMESENIASDAYTFSIRLKTYASQCDIEKIEMLVGKIKSDSLVSLTWGMYCSVASGYVKAGMIDEALDALKKSEELISHKDKAFPYGFLLTLYASCGKREEVYRIWDLCNDSPFKLQNATYMCMISSLLRLDEIDAAHKIFDQWESKHVHFDFRVLNLFISDYCKKGMLDKAEEMVNNAIKSGKEPTPGAWDALAGGYYGAGQIDKAIDALKKAILASRHPWEPKRVSLASCTSYLKDKGDINAAVDLINFFRESGSVSQVISEQLLGVVLAGNERSVEISDEYEI